MVRVANSALRKLFKSPQVNLYTSDIEKSKTFYHDILGLNETFRIPKEGNPYHVEFQLGSIRLGIATIEALKDQHGISGGIDLPREEIVLFVDDVDGAYHWAITNGANSLVPPRDFRGYLHNARIADPDGNPVVFVARLPLPKSTATASRPVIRDHLINLFVTDVEKSIYFYSDLFGFKETFRASGKEPSDHVEMELDSLNLGVSTVKALKEYHGISAGGKYPRGEIVLWVEDVDSMYSILSSKGITFLAAPHNFGGILRAAFAADPDGNPVQIVMNTNRN